MLPPDAVSSSENIGPVRGEELKPLKRSEMLEEESDRVSLLDVGRFLLSSFSISGSIVSMLRCSHPFFTFRLARARRSWRARVIYENVNLNRRVSRREIDLGYLGPLENFASDIASLFGMVHLVGVLCGRYRRTGKGGALVRATHSGE